MSENNGTISQAELEGGPVVSYEKKDLEVLIEKVAQLEIVVGELVKFYDQIKDNPYIKKPKGGLI